MKILKEMNGKFREMQERHEGQVYRDKLAKKLKKLIKDGTPNETLLQILSNEKGTINYAESFYAAKGKKMNDKMARDLINSGNWRYVYNNLTKFKPLSNDVLKTLDDKNRECWYKMRDSLCKERYRKRDEKLQFVIDCIKKDDFNYMYYDNEKIHELFKYITQHEFAQLLVNIPNSHTKPHGQIDKLADRFHLFTGLDPVEYAQIIVSEYGSEYEIDTPWSCGIVSPMVNLIWRCKTITPEFIQYINSLGNSSFMKEIEQRMNARNESPKDLSEKAKNKEELIADFIIKRIGNPYKIDEKNIGNSGSDLYEKELQNGKNEINDAKNKLSDFLDSMRKINESHSY